MFLNCFSNVSSTSRLFFNIKHVLLFSSPLKKLFIVGYKRGEKKKINQSLFVDPCAASTLSKDKDANQDLPSIIAFIRQISC